MAAFVADAITFNTTAGDKTVAITPALGDLLVVIAANTGTTTDPTVTDDRAGTYTRITGCTKNTSADEMHIYVRTQLCQLTSSHTITEGVGGAGTGGGATVIRISGMEKVGANAVRQSATQDNQAAAGTPAPVLARPVLTESLVIGAVFNATNVAALTQPANWTERRDVGYATPTSGLETATDDSGETGTTITWGSTSASAFCSLVAELDTATPSAIRRPIGPPHEWLRRRLPFPARDLFPVAAASTPQALTATVTMTATIQNQVGKIISATATSTATMVRQVSKLVSATSTSTAAIVKSVGKTLSATATSTASITAIKVILLAMTATVTTTATMVRSVGKLISATATSTATIVKSVGKTLSATATSTATIGAIKATLLTMTATVTSTATMLRSVGLHISATATSTASIVKSVGKRITATTVTSTASLVTLKVILKAMTATVTTTATITRSVAKALSATVTASATIVKQVAIRLTATVTSLATMVRDVLVAGAVVLFGYFSNRPREQDFDTPAPGGEFDPPDASGEVDE